VHPARRLVRAAVRRVGVISARTVGLRGWRKPPARAAALNARGGGGPRSRPCSPSFGGEVRSAARSSQLLFWAEPLGAHRLSTLPSNSAAQWTARLDAAYDLSHPQCNNGSVAAVVAGRDVFPAKDPKIRATAYSRSRQLLRPVSPTHAGRLRHASNQSWRPWHEVSENGERQRHVSCLAWAQGLGQAGRLAMLAGPPL